MKYTKKRILSIIINCAKEYKNELLNKNLLFVCMNKHKKIFKIEVSFKAENYLHLTGCKLRDDISAKDFFNRCINNRLKIDDFDVADDGTTQIKIEVLPFLIKKNLSANMLGDFSGSNIKLYTEKAIGNVKACVGFVKTNNGTYVPNTVLNVDIRKYVRKPMRIIATYRKEKAQSRYSELVYKAKNVKWQEVNYPEEIKYLQNSIKE